MSRHTERIGRETKKLQFRWRSWTEETTCHKADQNGNLFQCATLGMIRTDDDDGEVRKCGADLVV